MKRRREIDLANPDPVIIGWSGGAPCTLTYHYQREGVEDIVEQLSVGTQILGRKKWNYTDVGVPGADFFGWYYDPECTKQVPDDALLEGDLEIYGKWQLWDEETTRLMARYADVFSKAREASLHPAAYERESFNELFNAYSILHMFHLQARRSLSDGGIDALEAVEKALEQLVPTGKKDEEWYIWGENMPQAGKIPDEKFYYAFDEPDFRPLLHPSLLSDQSKVKGNIIVVAGGAYDIRCNSHEGYCVAERFNELGYNCYVLQRRVWPWSATDAHIDLQRAVRYLRFNAAKLGIAHPDRIAAVGFSGGGMTICGTISDFYGDELPTKVYPGYVPDEIDRVNSDLQVAMIIYGALGPIVTENPNMPSVFFAEPQEDMAFILKGTLECFASIHEMGVRCDCHIFADAPHGFGTGGSENTVTGGRTGAAQWTKLADTFMMVEYGLLPAVFGRE